MIITQRPHNRTSKKALAICCAWAVFGAPWGNALCMAQDAFGVGDPFGSTDAVAADDAFGGQPAAKPMAPASGATLPVEDADPIVRLLREKTPSSPAAMADGLTWTIRLKRWDEVGRLLDRIQSLNWSLEQKAAVARRMGAAMVQRMRSTEATLTDAQKSFAAQLFQAPSQLTRDPAWIDRTIDKLASDVAAERRAAQLRLHDAGSVGIARLVNRLLADDARVSALQLATAANSFGDDGAEALRAACLVRDVPAANRVLNALADLGGGEFGTELGAAIFSRNFPVAELQDLSSKLASKYPSLPSAQTIEKHLATRFGSALQIYQQQRTLDSELTDYVWRPAANGNSIERVEAPISDKALETAARLAAYRMQLQTAAVDGLVDSAAILMQRTYKVRPQLFAGELPNYMLADIAPEVRGNIAFWQSVFSRCEEWQLHGAAIRSLQLMADGISTGEFDASMSFLTRLLKDPTPAIRYTALEILAKLDPKANYYGHEWALETAVEMTRLQSGPQALVIGLQSELRQAAQQQINLQTSSDVTVVNSGVAALKALKEPNPYELILIVDRVADTTISQLIQRIRNTDRGRSLPIAVLTEELYSYERELINETPGLITSVLSRNAEQMERVIALMQAGLDTTPLTAMDRASFAASANRFLAHIATNREHYAFYPLNNWHSAIVQNSSGVTEANRLALLSGLGSAEAQWKLAGLTTVGSMSEQDRMEAAKAFARSVKKFGMNLHRDNVVTAYELYNEFGPKDPVATKAVGLVLDVIEAQAGRTPWPEGF
jgi:CheY-like chemotaxis protein